jgi:hypothetical protein
MPAVLCIVGNNTQKLPVKSVCQFITVAAHNVGDIGAVAHNKRHEENAQSALTNTRWE